MGPPKDFLQNTDSIYIKILTFMSIKCYLAFSGNKKDHQQC